MKMNNKLPLIVGISVAIGIALGSLLNYENSSGLALTKPSKQQKIRKLLNFIENEYVDEIDTDELLDEVIGEVVDKLDPHSVYFTKEQQMANLENMQGNFEGIGVQFFMNNDSLVVTQILKGGPSEKAGLEAGDRILIADNDTLYNKNLSSRDIVRVLKGPSGTDVRLTVYRKSEKTTFQQIITRNRVPIQSAEVAYMLTENLGYIKLDRFAMTSYREFKKNLNSLQNQGADKLVLDLRQNGGGFIHIANKIVDEFLNEGQLIVFTENNKGRKEQYFASAKGSFQEGKIYVLIDENSASASEILAGALQDNDKGVIIGRRSFGKGLVQEEMNLGDGSAVRLTIARYYTPTGRSIQKPYKLDDNDSYDKDYENRVLNGELLSKDSIKVNDSLRFTTPKGKVVYGGGGIVPDVFVPIDTTAYIENFYYTHLNDFTFKYVDNRRNELQQMGEDQFVATFDAKENVLSSFLAKVKAEEKLSGEKKAVLIYYLKALIARQAFGETAFYKVSQSRDLMIKRVLELEKGVVE